MRMCIGADTFALFKEARVNGLLRVRNFFEYREANGVRTWARTAHTCYPVSVTYRVRVLFRLGMP